jgi:polyisoprenyl-teichoic acid--peptidoglycan teichoic acid transferase
MCPELVEGHTASTSSARRPQRFLPRKASQVSIRTAELAPRPTASLRRSHKSAEQSERIRRRRGLTLLAMTLVLPGSAQIVAGNRRLGRLALRIWVSLCLLALLGALLALILPEAAVAVVTFGPTLVAIQIVIITLGLGWVALIVDAGRLAHPRELERRSRLGFAALSLAIALTMFGGFIAAASMASAQRDLTATVFSGGGDQVAKQGRYNILLLGGDAARDRVGLRPDSMTVASVDAETGRTVLISLPRNLQAVPFPSNSPMHDRFPNGYRCSDGSCMLNAIYTYASQHRDLYPGLQNPGAQATKEAVEGATGLKINYWVMIDLQGFRSLVDSVGGITMDVYRRVPIGGGSTQIHGYVEAGKNRHLNGYEALWFARSRSDSSDYDRMVRQKCVMNAMLNQFDPITVLTKFNRIAAASRQVVATDIPTSEVGTMIALALRAKGLPVSSVAMMPPLIDPNSPDFTVVRGTIQKRIEASEAIDRPVAHPTPAEIPSATTKPKPTASSSKNAQTDDLGKVCAV